MPQHRTRTSDTRSAAPSRAAGLTLVAAALAAALASGCSRADTAESARSPGDGAEPARTRTFGSDWPTFLGPEADGTSPETGILTDWSGGLEIVWQIEAGEGYGAPTTSRGRLFFFDRHGDQARLAALNAETGEELWRREYSTSYEDLYGYSGGPRASAVVDEDRVYTFGTEGRLRAHRVADGKLLFDLDTSRRYGVQQNFFGVGSTPVIEGDLLIAMIGGSPPGSPSTTSGNATPNGSAIVAFDKLSGEERYRLGDDLASYAGLRVATLGDRRLGLAFVRGGLIGFEPSEGRQEFFFPWRARRLESVNASTPVVEGTRVFLTETYGPGGVLLEIGEGQPEVVWKDGRRAQAMASHWSTPIHRRGTLYGSSGMSSGNADLRAVDFATGKVLWSEPGLERTSLLYVDGHFVVLGERGQVDLVRASPERFERVGTWRPQDKNGRALLRYPAWNAPVLSPGRLYVRGWDRLLAAELIPSPSREGAEP
ncbi:MAG: PQQ-binding-like beta-propeller repeat protein [Acidobacteriota bacterium]